MIQTYNIIDINIFSSVILLVIFVNTLLNYRNLPLSARYRMLLVVCLLIIFLTDSLSRIDMNFSRRTVHAILYIENFVYFLLQPLPVSLSLMYLFSIFREKRFSFAVHMLFLIPFFIGLAAVVYSIFTGFIFYIDDMNEYHRGPGMFVYAVTNYSFAFPAFWLVIRFRDRIKRRTLMTVIAYTILPYVGSFLQLCHYGIITAWPSFTLAVFITYIFLEVKNNEQDYLTGLLNRHYFEIHVYNRIEQYSKRGAFSLVVIDLDNFKAINDVYGHRKGDEFLQATGFILSRSVSINDTVARYGGDEFVIVLETVEREIVETVLNRINENISMWNKKRTEPAGLSLSAGYAVFDPQIHTDYSDLFSEADSLMFENKRKNGAG